MSEVDFSFCYWSRNIQYIDYAYVFIVILYYFGDEDMDFFFCASGDDSLCHYLVK